MTTTPIARSPFSIELALVVGLPLLTIFAGAYAMCLAYTRGFTPEAPAAAPVAQIAR
jgi:hypothetical protein